MANVAHEPVKRAMSRIRELSADEETRRLAFVRERALRDEVSFLNDARREGREEGIEEGRQEGSITALEGALRSQIKLKFGEVPAWADHRIQQADDAELSEWVVQILSADSLEALLLPVS